MKYVKGFFLCLIYVLFSLNPGTVLAADTCPCSCNSPSGIVNVGNYTPADCITACTGITGSTGPAGPPVCPKMTSATPPASGPADTDAAASGSASEGTKGSSSSDVSAPATPSPAPATSTTCDCWCTSKDGAKKLDKKQSVTECTASCKKSGERVAACAFKVDQSPERSGFCFTKELCAKQKGIMTPDISLTAFKQAPDCIPGQSYCYPDPKFAAKSTLNVAIGEYKISGDMAEYINILVKWMLGAGSVIAIVLVMVGGLQYTLGAGKPDYIATAKKRMINAVTGLILLLCSYLILFTVNPYLVRMQVPKYPMVKRIDLVEPTSCETMEKEYVVTDINGEKIPDANKKCGTPGKVEKKKDGSSVASVTCDYQKCPKKEETCLGQGEKAQCLRCGDLTYQSTSSVPSTESCSKLKLPDEKNTIDNKVVTKSANYCFYTHDPTVVLTTAEVAIVGAITGTAIATGPLAMAVGAAGITAGPVANMVKGSCAELKVECENIKVCNDYDTEALAKSLIRGYDTGSKMENFFISDSWSDFNLKKLCAANPCSVAHGGKVATSCAFDEDASLMRNCIPAAGLLAGAKDGCASITCPSGQGCISDPSGNPVCTTCGHVVDNNKLGKDGAKIVPTPAMCTSLTAPGYICEYTKESALTSNDTDPLPSCAEVYLNCDDVGDSCTGYDSVQADNDAKILGKVKLEDTNVFKEKPLLKKYCEENPCSTLKGGKIAHPCKYDGGSDCEDP